MDVINKYYTDMVSGASYNILSGHIMKSSERLKAKRAQKQKVKDDKLKAPEHQEEKQPAEIAQKGKKKRTTTKQLRKALLSLAVNKTEKGKEVVIHDKYQIEETHPLFDAIEKLVKLLEEKEKKKDAKVLEIIEYSNFPNFEFVLRNVKPEDEKCCICQYEFQKAQDYQKELTGDDDYDILHLNCSHLIHKTCFLQLLGDKNWIKCPLCYTIFGEMTGDQPKGKMTHRIQKDMVCDGYPKGTIVIDYSFPSGERNGVHYSGTHRTAYLPNTPQGQEVFKLLKIAFDRKLTFTIGRSVTTGMDNQVVWNGIHHKTHTHGGSAHFGYPDPTYFSRVKIELAMKGVC